MTGEVEALARTLGREAALGAGGIGAVHAAIADRVFRAVGPAAAPARATHDVIAAATYAAIGGSAALAGRAAGAALPAREVSGTRRGAIALAVLNGLHGDALESEGSALQVPMALRAGGRIARVHEQLPNGRLAHRRARPRAVRDRGRMDAAADGYGARWRASSTSRRSSTTTPACTFPATAAASRSARGAMAAWRCRSRRSRSSGTRWAGSWRAARATTAGREGAHVRHVFSLGSPLGGAPLESAVHYAAAGLGTLPETRPFAGFLRRRSAGIRDLRSAALVDADWRGATRTPCAPRPAPRCRCSRAPPTASSR